MSDDPRYVIYVDHEGEEGVMMTAPLAEEDRDYFVRGILPVMRPMTHEEYMHGPMYLLHTLAKTSYLLHQRSVYWCIEWEPGLIVVRFSPDDSLAAAALRSPNPEFGGREPSEEDLREYDEGAENHQYNLIFQAWDAQFDTQMREWNSFTPADEETARRFDAAMEHAQALGERMEAEYGGKPDEIARWRKQAAENLARWAGQGVRIRM
jgi:hypothetical protein